MTSATLVLLMDVPLVGSDRWRISTDWICLAGRGILSIGLERRQMVGRRDDDGVSLSFSKWLLPRREEQLMKIMCVKVRRLGNTSFFLKTLFFLFAMEKSLFQKE